MIQVKRKGSVNLFLYRKEQQKYDENNRKYRAKFMKRGYYFRMLKQ